MFFAVPRHGSGRKTPAYQPIPALRVELQRRERSANEKEQTMAEKKKAGEDSMQGREREQQIVLVVDGDCARQFLTCVLLQRLGYHVFPVKTAEEALMIMELAVPLIVLTEISLPQMNGIDLLKQVKQNPRSRHVPVLIYTALKGVTYRQTCESAGCAGFITQPAEHNELYEAIQNATENTPRHFVRLTTSLDVVVGTGTREGGKRNEKMTAISERGMYVRTPNPLPYGTTVPFTLYLDRSMARVIRVEGKVLYSHSGGDPSKAPGMGVKFTQIRPEDREGIRAFIRQQLMEGIAVPIRTSKD